MINENEIFTIFGNFCIDLNNSNFWPISNSAVWSNAVDRIRLLQKLFFALFCEFGTNTCKNFVFKLLIYRNAAYK